MPAASKKRIAPKISDAAVEKATGKRWEQWFAELDAAGAAAWPHKRIARHVLDGYMTTVWWAQTIAVAYENARGLREKHEMPDGYQIQRQKRIDAPMDAIWELWTDPGKRQEWLPESSDASVHKVREDKRVIRFHWPDGSRVLAGVQSLDDDRSTCGVQQSRLADAGAAEAAKAFWAQKLTELKTKLE